MTIVPVTPLVTDDDRRSGLQIMITNAGRPEESKRFEVVADKTILQEVAGDSVPSMGHISSFPQEFVIEARTRFANVVSVGVDEVDGQRFARISLGVEVWACANVVVATTEQNMSCCSIFYKYRIRYAHTALRDIFVQYTYIGFDNSS